MKTQLSLILFFLCLSFSIQITNNKESNLVDSVSYSEAAVENDKSYLLNSSEYTNPIYVDKLPAKKMLRGESISISSKKSENENFYAGMDLVSSEVSEVCDKWSTVVEACSKSNKCGWCASTKKCVAGDADKPFNSCNVADYKFTVPPENWNPFPADQKVKIEKSDNITTITPIDSPVQDAAAPNTTSAQSKKRKADNKAVKKHKIKHNKANRNSK